MGHTVQRTRRRQQREETRQQILNAALEFLEDHSFREMSVEALMTRTGHTRTVFYRHFEDVPALLLALIAEIGGELVAVGEAWSAAGQADPTEARRRLELFVAFYVRHGRVARAVAEAAHHDPVIHQAYAAMVEGFVTMTAEAMQDRIDRGMLEPLDVGETARALVLMANAYLADRLGGPDRADPARVLETVATIWTRTLFGRT